jgi:hypothetical protein
MTPEIKKLALYLKLKYEEGRSIAPHPDCWNLNYQLPIDTIHDIGVSCEIKIQRNHLIFGIEAKNVGTDGEYEYSCRDLLYDVMYDKKVDFTIEDYEVFVKKVFDTLEKIQFDKMSGRFATQEKIRINREILEPIRLMPHIKMTYDTCAVCLDFTETKTQCKHHLCVYCWDKIKRKYCGDCDNGRSDCEKIDCGRKPCPICRQSIEHPEE